MNDVGSRNRNPLKWNSSVGNNNMHWRRMGSTLLFITFGIFSIIILPYRQRQWFLLHSITKERENGADLDETYAGRIDKMNETVAIISFVGILPESNRTILLFNDTSIIPPNHNFMGIVARPFSSWPMDLPLPCHKAQEQWMDLSVQFSPAAQGFFYLKPYTTGSSPTSGVHLRIARNVAQRRMHPPIDICETRFDHGPDYTPGYTLFRDRIPEKSFLWTVLRDPTQRAISEFFHIVVSRQKKEPADQNFKQFLRQSSHIPDYYYRALYTKEKFNRNSLEPIPSANYILQNYNFIGITERMDESFVVLMMLLRLKIADILYISAKTKGGYDDAGGRRPQTCTYIWPSFVSPGMKEFFGSKEWLETVRYDRLLYEAVNRSLDLTIDQLGRERFQEQLHIFHKAQEVAKQRCLPNATFPCDASGRFHAENTTDCIWKDSGCGTSCLDEIATELDLW
jgi:hypothetical protein